VTAILGIVGDLPATRVLVLSASGAHEDVLEAVKAGASGYLVKSASVEELVDAVRRTAAGDAVFTAGPGRPGTGRIPPNVYGSRRRRTHTGTDRT